MDKKIQDISIGQQQRVEILKALYRGAEILILDEPTAVLTDEEVEGLFQIIGKLKMEGKSVIFISHKMREVMRVSDIITILRAGESVATFNIEEVTAEQLANTMVGRELKESKFNKVSSTKDDMVVLNNIGFNVKSKHSSLRDISLYIKKGEILGVAGVDGNGQSQLAGVLSGNIKPDSGEYFLNGQKIEKFTPKSLIDKKVSHIPEDRNKMGLVGEMTVAENIVLKKT